MKTVAEYRHLIAELLAPVGQGLGFEAVRIDAPEVAGRVIAKTLTAERDLPIFTNSQMDGYAVYSADLAAATTDSPVELPVAPMIAAGSAPTELLPGLAAPIMTGAPLPADADTVVPIERADPPRFHSEEMNDGDAHLVRFSAPSAPGTFVRKAGSDIAQGEVLIEAGTVLTPPRLGALAASGVLEVPVRRRASVLVVATGSELAGETGGELEPGQIFDANTAMLLAAVRECGADARAVRVADDPEALRAALGSQTEIDLVLSAGGISAGAFEVVRQTLGEAAFEHIGMQPGGPQGHGMVQAGSRSVPLVAFPGNPVSALISFEMFVRPVLREWAGRSPWRVSRQVRLAEGLDSVPGKHQVRRGEFDEYSHVRMVGGASSHLLHAYSRASLLVHIPQEVEHLDAGDLVEVWEL